MSWSALFFVSAVVLLVVMFFKLASEHLHTSKTVRAHQYEINILKMQMGLVQKQQREGEE